MIKPILLWSSLGLSTILSAGFFFSLGEEPVSGTFLALLGIIFEGLKAYSWNKVGSQKLSYLWLSVPCTVLSLAASIGYASLTLERGWSNADTALRSTELVLSDRAALDREESALIDAISKLPPGWTTSTLRLSERLDTIRNSKAVEPAIPTRTAEVASTATLAASLGRRLGLDPAWVVSLLLFAIATVLEVGIIVLVLDRDIRKHPQASSDQASEADRFLREAVGPEGKLLGRRRLVELGWSEKQVRDHVTTLLKSGVLTHQGRGSPIRLSVTS